MTLLLDSWIYYIDDQSLSIMNDIESLKKPSDNASTTHWDSLINALSSMVRAAEHAELIVRNMEHWSPASAAILTSPSNTHGNNIFRTSPTSHHYDVVIHAWAKIIRLYPILVKLVPSSPQGPDPRRMTLRSLLHGIPQRTTLLLEAMERGRGLGVQPTVDTYNTVLEIWAYSHEHHRRSMVQSIFHRMSTGGGTKDLWNGLHIQKINTGNGGSSSISSRVTQVIMPTRKTLQIMIQAWCQLDTTGSGSSNPSISSSYAFHATYYLLQMISLLEKGTDDFEPTLMDFKQVLQAWASTEGGSKKSAYRALSILHKLELLYNNRQTQVRPDIECYKFTLQCLAKMDPIHMPGVGERVDRLFQHIQDRNLLPDSGCFSAAIETWCNLSTHYSSTSPIKAIECIKRAEGYLKQMSETFHRSSTIVVRPKTVNYNTILKTLVEISSPMAVKTAENLLYKMEILSKDGDWNVQPNTSSYSSVIQCWGQSSDPHAVDNAHKLLDRLMFRFKQNHAHCQPSTELFNAILSVCSSDCIHASENDKALQCAFSAMQKMQSLPRCEPDSHSYSLLIQMIGHRIPPGSDRSKALESIFKKCCSEGLVDTTVLKSLQKYSPEELYTKLLQPSRTISDNITNLSTIFKTLPLEWTVRVKGVKVKLEDGRTIPLPIKVDGTLLNLRNPALNERKMKRLRSKVNQRLLRGGRMQG